jgi:hypothetical protein
VNRPWVRAREAAGLAEDLVLYCARHGYGSFMLRNSGNLRVSWTSWASATTAPRSSISTTRSKWRARF